IDFVQTDKPAKPAAEVKHVKVRSSVDIMAELEALRKKATTPKPAAPKKEPSLLALATAAAGKPKDSPRELRLSLLMQAATGILKLRRTLRVTVSFESEDGTMKT